MEGATRVFAGDFAGSTLSVQEGDPGSPAWVVTPGGAWCRSVYLCGALTEVNEAGDSLQCRLADPTGAFDIWAGGRGPAADQIRKIPVPSFIGLTGTVQLRKNSEWTVSVRLESVWEIDKAARNRWVVETADMMLGRLEQLLAQIEGTSADAKSARAINHYHLNRDEIRKKVALVETALAGIPQTTAPAAPVQADISPAIMEIIQGKSGPRGVAVQEVIDEGISRGYTQAAVLEAIGTLVTNDDCYQPQKGFVKPL